MIKKLPLSFIATCIFFMVFGASCKKESELPLVQLQTYTGNLKFEFQPQSIQKVFTAQTSWETKAINYFNILNDNNYLRMFYGAFAYNQTDYEGSFCLANSIDGENWNRDILHDSTNILIPGTGKDGITGSCVFIDSFDAVHRYKLICCKLVDNKQETYLYASQDAIKWTLVKKLFDVMQDSQFSVIRMNGQYYVYCRYNDYANGYQRAIGLFRLDNYMNVIQEPKLLLKPSPQDAFPHIYNSAVSKINDSAIVMFPTYYNEDNGNICIRLIYSNNAKDYYLVNDNINSYLFNGANVNWSIVSPSLLPAAEPNTYWVYYFTTPVSHNSIPYTTNINITYYRIKLKITRN